MFKEIVDDARQTTDIGRSQKLTVSTLCSGELKKTLSFGILKNLGKSSKKLTSIITIS